MFSETSYYLKPAAAYVRGRREQSPDFDLPEILRVRPLDELSAEQLAQICQAGAGAGLRLDRYKRSRILPRVQKVLGALQGIQPSSLLDIGSGRGAFLWPLLDRFPMLRVTAIEASPKRAAQLQAVALGGLENLSAYLMDATAVDFDGRCFDVVTALEVLEHIPRVQAAVAEMCRLAQRFVIASVPSKEDSNPEHIHLLSPAALRALFAGAGVDQIKVEHVLNHRVVIATMSYEHN